MKWLEAVLKTLFGTDTECRNYSSQEDSVRQFSDVFQEADPSAESDRRFTDTTFRIEKMEQSLARLGQPALSLDEAIKQIMEPR